MSTEPTNSSLEINIRELATEEGIPFSEGAGAESGAAIFARIVSRFLSIAIIVGAIALLFNLVVGGIQWIVAGGESGKIEKAKTRITQSIVGIFVLSASVAVFMLINYLLGSPVAIRFAGGGGGGGYGAGPCPCQNAGGHAGYASIGQVGRLYNSSSAPCYECTAGGWSPVSGTCGVISCSN